MPRAPHQVLTRDDYYVGWICAIPVELTAALGALEQRHPKLAKPRSDRDPNTYHYGSIGGHNIVITCLPAGRIGNNAAAVTAIYMLTSFENIRFGLMVGVGGGVPSAQNDIRLGDIVIGQPSGSHGGVFQYDFGKAMANGVFLNTGSLNMPPKILLSALSSIQAHSTDKVKLGKKISKNLEVITRSMTSNSESANPITFIGPERSELLVNEGKSIFSRPIESDHLYEAAYNHFVGGETCARCDFSKRIIRENRNDEYPRIHYGLIASGNQVMKDSIRRDEIGQKSGAICFEMEAAGLVNDFPCLVVRGICDYSDSHKNKEWQPYAALVAALFTRELLVHIPADSISTSPRRSVLPPEDLKCLKALRSKTVDPEDARKELARRKDELISGSYEWIMKTSEFESWLRTPDCSILQLVAGPGRGKTMIMMGITDVFDRNPQILPDSAQYAYFFCQETDIRFNNAEAVLLSILFQILQKNSHLIKHLKSRLEYLDDDQIKNEGFGLSLLQTVLLDLFQDSEFPQTFIFVDAIDEISHGLEDFILFACRTMQEANPVKWLFSSRHRGDIQPKFRTKTNGKAGEIHLEDDLHLVHVKENILRYISIKVGQLARHRHYDEDEKDMVEKELNRLCEDTFLWVNLACKELEDVYAYAAIESLSEWKPGLTEIYKRMISKIQKMGKATTRDCFRLLEAAVATERPLRLREIAVVGALHPKIKIQDVDELINKCGSFFGVMNGFVKFIHKSAKDFLVEVHFNYVEKKSELTNLHEQIALRCLLRLSADLKKDILNLRDPTFLSDALSVEQESRLGHIDYAACYWISHVRQAVDNIPGEEVRFDFNAGLLTPLEIEIQKFMKNHFLNWLEVLSLIRQIPQGILQLRVLRQALTRKASLGDLSDLLKDAERFLRFHQADIISWPLQIYYLALLFCPTASIIRENYEGKAHNNWIDIKQTQNVEWDPRLQHVDPQQQLNIEEVAYSPFSDLFLTRTSFSIRVWDKSTGGLQCAIDHFNQHEFLVNSAWKSTIFLPDNRVAAIASDSCSIYDINTGKIEFILRREASSQIKNSERILAINFSNTRQQLQMYHIGGEVSFWSTESSIYKLKASTRLDHHPNMTFLYDGWHLPKPMFSADGNRIFLSFYRNPEVYLPNGGKRGSSRISYSRVEAFEMDPEPHKSSFTMEGLNLDEGPDCRYSFSAITGKCEYHKAGGMLDAHGQIKRLPLRSSSAPDRFFELVISRSPGRSTIPRTLCEFWAISSGKHRLIDSIELPGSSIGAAAMSSDGRLVAFSFQMCFDSPEMQAKFPNLSNSNPREGMRTRHTIQIYRLNSQCDPSVLVTQTKVWSLEFSLDGTNIISASTDGLSQIWDVTSAVNQQDLLREKRYLGASDMRLLSVSKDQRMALCCSEDQQSDGYRPVACWDLENGAEVYSFEAKSQIYLLNDYQRDTLIMSPERQGIYLSHDSRTLTYMTNGGFVIANLNEKGQTVTEMKIKHSALVSAISPNGRIVVTGGLAGRISFWDARKGLHIMECTALKPSKQLSSGRQNLNAPPIQGIHFSPNGRYLICFSLHHTWGVYDDVDDNYQKSAGHWQRTETISIYEISTNKIKPLELYGEDLQLSESTCCFSPDSRWLSCSTKEYLSIYNLADLNTKQCEQTFLTRRVWRLDERPVNSAFSTAFSQDSKLLFEFRHITLTCWNVETGVVLSRFRYHQPGIYNTIPTQKPRVETFLSEEVLVTPLGLFKIARNVHTEGQIESNASESANIARAQETTSPGRSSTVQLFSMLEISHDNWIVAYGKKIIHIPTDYQPMSVLFDINNIVITGAMSFIYTLKYDLDALRSNMAPEPGSSNQDYMKKSPFSSELLGCLVEDELPKGTLENTQQNIVWSRDF